MRRCDFRREFACGGFPYALVAGHHEQGHCPDNQGGGEIPLADIVADRVFVEDVEASPGAPLLPEITRATSADAKDFACSPRGFLYRETFLFELVD